MGGGAGYRRTPLRGVDRTRRKSVTSTIFDNQKQPRSPGGQQKKKKTYLDFGALPPTAAGVFFCARRLIRPSMPSCFTTASNSER